MPQLIQAFKQLDDDALGLALVEGLASAPARSVLRPGDLRTLFEKFGPTVLEADETIELFEELDSDGSGTRNRIEELLPMVAQGDLRRGQAIFNGQKGACRSCHTMGYVGGQIGPDLTRIGAIRTERDLLEAIIDPSASFVRSFEPVLIATVDGRIYSGTVVEETSDAMTLALGPEDRVRVLRSEIEAIRPGTTSVMPSGLDQQLSDQELADLIVFLKASR